MKIVNVSVGLPAAGLVLMLAAFPLLERSHLPSWPPHPKEMITARWDFQANQSQGDVTEVYQVPQDSWLVIEDFQGPSNSFSLIEVGAGTMLLGGFQQVEWRFNSALRDIGIAFPPGSRVGWRNDGIANTFPDGWMVGYLVKD